MPTSTLRERLPQRTLRAAVTVAVLAGSAACGSHDSSTDSAKPVVPDLDLGAVKALTLDANDSFGVMTNGVYTVAGQDITGVDIHTGQKLWHISSPTTPDKNKIQVVDSGHVLVVGAKDAPGLTAYDTGTGQQLWSTPAEEWFESDDSTGQFVHNDPRTGAKRWSVDPGTVGCATPLSKDLPALFDLDVPSLAVPPDVDTFRCAAPNGRFVVGGLDRTTGATAWHREVPEKGSFLRGPGRIGTVEIDGKLETIDMGTGKSLSSRKPSSDKELRIQLADGSALTLDSYVMADNKNMRLQEPDGTTRWTVTLDPKEESQPLMASSGNAVFTLVGERADSSYKAWLIAYDTKDGKRTVVAGPGPTAAGEKPTLTMNLGAVDTGIDPASWGLLVTGPDNGYAVIPVKH
ncbi:PQQ-binding-like beta-propeller repeat protein [Nocardia sp. ET3-3]|uniref:PQQ-binding-like beta-propeller repeat protein n=1 Tax=Nocardia terrae TaxID=2675851 RepID=A0A7K1UQG7_9NOCA|nr:PQQ-binding-like beta-propeller repeat protein [Nocardia terrae]MVU76581.1 PQQ-binding-like beta-propeller repeat protein [Nocardia terrae]